MSLTLVEKIAGRFAVGVAAGKVRSGDYITIRPKHVMTHDNTGAVIPKFQTMGASRIADPSQPVFAIDHDIQNKSEANLAKYAKIEQFAREQGVDFYPPGTGISHQVMVEKGYVIPGSLVVGSDSHSNMYGAVSALGTPVVRTDAAAIWATGQTWWQVPPAARVTLNGRLGPGVTGKDVIITLCGKFNQDEVLNHAVEFVGDGISSMTMEQRLSIANMTTEWGALAGVFPFDAVLRDYLLSLADGFEVSGSRVAYTRKDVEAWFEKPLCADADARYDIEITLDLNTVTPHVSGPDHVKTMTSVAEIEPRRIAIDKAYLLSCTNARLEDLRDAASVLRGRRVAAGVELYVAAASADIRARAEADGTWQTLIDAGALPLPSGCGPCIGLGQGTIGDGEVGISATNRNFKGRMGSKEAQVYLASPAVVAASAAAGHICAPSAQVATEVKGSFVRNAASSPNSGETEIIDGFPEKIVGRALYMAQNNLNTDGIFAGKWTYNDDMKPEEMARVVFENYDENFGKIYRQGDIVVSGRNFGTGSSREQAATALMYRGIPCVIAASFSETYKRNAFNNGFPLFECEGLVDYLGNVLSDQKTPTAVGPDLVINFRRSTVSCDDQIFQFAPLGRVPQELIVAGGAENLVRNRAR